MANTDKKPKSNKLENFSDGQPVTLESISKQLEMLIFISTHGGLTPEQVKEKSDFLKAGQKARGERAVNNGQ